MTAASPAATALDHLLARAARRARQQQLAAIGPRLGAVGIVAIALTITAVRSEQALLALIMIGAALALLVRFRPSWRRSERLALALRLDRANGLNELLSTAVAGDGGRSALYAEVLQRAESVSGQIPVASLGPIRPSSRELIWIGAGLALFGFLTALIYIPPPPSTADEPRYSVPGDDGQLAGIPSGQAAAQAELLSALEPLAGTAQADLAQIASLLAQNPLTRNAGRALGGGDAAAAARALEELAAGLGGLTAAERDQIIDTMAAAAEQTGDPALAEPLNDLTEALSEGQSLSAAAAIDQLSQAIVAAEQNEALRAEIQSRLEALGGQPAAASLSPDGPAGGTAASAGSGSDSIGGSSSSLANGTIERLGADGTIRIVPLSPTDKPAQLEPRRLDLGEDSEPGRSPSAGMFGFALSAPALSPVRAPESTDLLRAYFESS